MNLHGTGKNLHHAYALVGNTDEILEKLRNFLKKDLQISLLGNPDFWYGEYDVLTVDDSRTLISLHQSTPAVGDKKIFIISANFITEQAQNAMLKMFEEPRGDTHFFLIIPSANNLIPTLRSRMMFVQHAGKNASLIRTKDFLQSSIPERIEEMKKLMASIADEEESKIEAVKFINALESELKGKTDFSKSRKGEIEVFERIEKVRQYASEQSPSLKMLLEYLAFLVLIGK